MTITQPTIANLPAPPLDKRGWPWTSEPEGSLSAEEDKNWPRISIVTPSYNQGAFIEETIRCVLLQGYPNLEYIIIDGGSADTTLDIIKKYEPWISYWVSEPDSGMYEALNKGLSRSTGEIMGWSPTREKVVKRLLSRSRLFGWFAHKTNLAYRANIVEWDSQMQTARIKQ